MLLPQGYGLRNTVDLIGIQYALDDLIKVHVTLEGSPVRVPVVTSCSSGWCARSTCSSSARGSARSCAPWDRIRTSPPRRDPVDRNRLIATVLSTVFAAWGQLFFLQNLGTLNTYSSHDQVGIFAIAALLVSGATVSRATSDRRSSA